jgi:hypothetical protein
MYAGSWNVNMGSTGKFVVGQITGDTGETLNVLGYNGSSGLGWSGVTNPVTLNGGTMVFAEDSINPGDSTPPQNVNSFRSPLTILAPAAIATSGLEYSSTTTGTSGAILDTTPVSANIAGDIDNFSQLTVDTYDPINGGARNLNFTTNGLSVAGNFTWEDGSSMVVSSGGTTGGELNFGRTAAQGGSVSVNGAATITINSGSTVNVGKTYSAAGGLVTVAGAVDPFTDAGVTSDPTDSDTTFSVAATVAGTLDYAARTGSTGDTGFKPYHLASLAIQSGGLVSMDTAAAHTNRSVLITSSVSIAGTGSLDLGGNDLMIPGGGSSALASVSSLIKTGFNAGAAYWNGTGGIVSSAARNDTRFLTTLGSAVAGPAGIAFFDGVTTGAADVLVKYTYYGDATLDGTVNGADYQQIDNGFGLHLTGWSNGDFNYDGVVDGSDYSLIDNTFNQITATGASPLALDGGSALIASGSNLWASPADLTPAAVPEPGSLTLLTIGAASLLGRRRRRA